ncbi:J domain-containing protein [Fusobacterium pseudoperiodonticum]|uniref:J domain-containing protein n=1 Tax=Fusobacterium pseudoperiodonticum TaxID=2663009 RepID=UPI0028D49D7D|nr:J domain-containing protein [Fusobacterium pseudoperiodonticum]
MEAILLPLMVMFFILVMTLGVDRASKAILPLTIIGILVYFFGWDIFKYAFLFILFIVFLIFFLIFKVLKKATTSSNTYRRTRTQNDDFFGGYRNNTSSNNNSNGTRENNTYSNTRYYGHFRTQEEFEEFIRNAFGGSFGGSTYGNSSGGYRQGGSYQRTGTYTSNRSRYYRILGLKDGASQEEIKKAYRQLAKEHHPDKFVNASDSEKKFHESKMKEINEAYENLKI